MSGKKHLASWRRRLSLLLTVALLGSQGMITPLAAGRDQAVVTVTSVARLPEKVRNQWVSLGTAEEQLNFPKYLEVTTGGQEPGETGSEGLYGTEDETASASGAEKASVSSGKRKNSSLEKAESAWRQVPVVWVLAEADNGLTAYDGETPGIYRFEARLEDDSYVTGDLQLPDITVKVMEFQGEFMDGIIDLGAPQTTVAESFFSLADGAVDLTDGNHEKWIDRIDVPDNVRDFYIMLEESVDNDGRDDRLIDDRYFSKTEAFTSGSYVFNGLPFAAISRTAELSDEEWNYIRKCATAVYDAFDRDHPEVFWLSGYSMMYWSCNVSRDSSGRLVYNYTFYWMTRVHEGNTHVGYDVRFDEYKSANAIKAGIRQIDQNVDKIIGEAVSSENEADQIIGFNEWLTTHNAYNTNYPNLANASKSAWECTSALAGRSGKDGPVCEGYARAFKVLCDRVGIPCVLVDGPAYGKADAGHMWNYVELDGEWYGVDVTWNDPFVENGEAISGYENTTYLLVGADTEDVSNGKSWKFIDSHPVNNNPRNLSFTNGPELSSQRYPAAVPTVYFANSRQTVTYTGRQPAVIAPVVEVNGRRIQNPPISYSYRSSGGSDYIDGLPVDAGSYTVRARADASKAEGYRGAYSLGTLSLTIEKAARTVPAPAIAGQTDDSITVNPVTPSAGAEDGTVEYAYSTDGNLPRGGWQTSPVITGLNRNTEYDLFARITGGKNYLDGVSQGTKGKTDRTMVPRPSLRQNRYPYTGETVSVELENFDGSIMRVTGNTAVETGDHQAIVTMSNEDFMWPDGTWETVRLDWKIMLTRNLPAPSVAPGGITETEIVLETALPVPAESAGDGTVEYGCAAENDSSKVSDWRTERTFTGLESGTTYYFFVRVTGGADYMDAVSPAAALTTKKFRLKKPAISGTGSYVYQGSRIQAAVDGYDSHTMNISGDTAVHAGEYTIKVMLTDSKHYEWEDGTAGELSFSWKITKKPVTVKAADKSKYYGEDNPALTLETPKEGVLAGTDGLSALNVTLSTTAEKNSAAGRYPITGTAAADGDYEVTIEEGVLTVGKRTRNLSAPSAAPGGITETEIVLETALPIPAESAGDGTVEYGCAAENDSSKVSDWRTERTFTGLESGTTYYFFARVAGGADYMDAVSPAAVLTTKRIRLKKPAISGTGSYVYQGSRIQAAVSGYDSHTMSISGDTAVHAGEYTIKVMLTDSKHYEWEDGTAGELSLSWKITKKPVTVKAADKSKYYGEDNPALTLETPKEGVLAGTDSLSALNVTLSTTAEKNSAAGRYPITGTAAADGDYEVTIEEGVLTVRKKASSGGGSGGSGGGGSSSGGGGGSAVKGQSGGSQPGSAGVNTTGKDNIHEGTWVHSEQSWFLQLPNGSYAASQWGLIDNRWYLFGQDSRMLTGWQKADGQWYFMHQDGAMATGWVSDNGRWYYMKAGGDMATNWEQVNGRWYFMNADGAMAVGWIADRGKSYYLGADGAMYASTTTPDGYQVNADGAWVVNGVVQVR